MATKRRDEQPPADFDEQLKKALQRVRVGDYDTAGNILQPLRRYLSADPPPMLVPGADPNDYHRLRLATLLAEVAEYRGDYEAMRVVLQPYDRIVRELQELQREGSALRFDGFDDPRRLLLRQKLYYLWQKSVWHYRTVSFSRSRDLLNLAIDLAERLHPKSEVLLTQLYYGAGKLAFHDSDERRAIVMYQQSLMSASQRLDIARDARKKAANKKKSQEEFDAEVEAARYSVAKTLALGLGQCLREQGRLKEAHAQVVAGKLLLNDGSDHELSHYALLLLGSIERSIAGEERPDLLQHAADQVSDCDEYFREHHGEVGYRARLERGLVTMQQKDLPKARTMLEEMLEPPPEDAKWVAECNLALSRLARRQESHGEAVEYARRAVRAAEGLERIKRRAQVVLVLALYDAAMAAQGEARDDLLKDTMDEIDRTMKMRNPDVRTRANMLLTTARVLKVRGEIARAVTIYRQQYGAIKDFVEVGRITELAKTVEKELEPAQHAFWCPADLESPNYSLAENTKALSVYLIEKVQQEHETAGAQAHALNMSRANYYKLLKKLKLPRP